MTDLVYLRDAFLRELDSTIVDLRTGDDGRVAVALDQTIFYPTGGGQPHDLGSIATDAGPSFEVVDVRKEGEAVWHTLAGPAMTGSKPGDGARGTIDWERRYALMRTHSALHVLGGVIWNRWGVLATGNNMEPLSARIDYEFDPLPERFAAELEAAINDEIAAARAIEVSFLPYAAAQADPELIRTKVNLIPASVQEIRVVEIVGLDRQADGGTHVRSTADIGRVRVVKTESKGKSNKRIRIAIDD